MSTLWTYRYKVALALALVLFLLLTFAGGLRTAPLNIIPLGLFLIAEKLAKLLGEELA